MFNLDLEDETNQLLLPSFKPESLHELRIKLQELGVKNHFLISSSGTTGGDWKGYLISKNALLTNAKAVNECLKLSETDVWGATLPYYHIGGLSIHFRAKLLGHNPVQLRPWNPQVLVEEIKKQEVTVISLVPSQVYDLVELNLASPKNLKTVLVGGDFMGQALAQKFEALGWPVVRTYGMSEVSSQLCTGMKENGFYCPLPIHDIKTNEFNHLLVKSRSFFSYFVKKKENWELTPLQALLDGEGYFKLADKGLIEDGLVKVLGRDDGQIKSSGHLINFNELKETLEHFCLEHHCWGKIELQSSPTEREGQKLTLHYLDSVPERTMSEFLERIHPVKIKDLQKHSKFKRTDLGKFKTVQT